MSLSYASFSPAAIPRAVTNMMGSGNQSQVLLRQCVHIPEFGATDPQAAINERVNKTKQAAKHADALVVEALDNLIDIGVKESNLMKKEVDLKGELAESKLTTQRIEQELEKTIKDRKKTTNAKMTLRGLEQQLEKTIKDREETTTARAVANETFQTGEEESNEG